MTKLLFAALTASLFLPAIATAQTQTALPPASRYVQVRNGHLSLDGQRQRYWAVIGKLHIGAGVKADDAPDARAQKVARSRRGTDALLDRFAMLGFNSSRMWDAVPNSESYVVGDGSRADAVDYYVAQMGRRGQKIWIASLNRTGEAKPEDVSVLGDAATADEWAKAVASTKEGKMTLRNNVAKAWDPRLEAIALRDMEAIATHRNKHNGLRWSDDPTFAVWELSNEEWWMRRMVGGDWQKLPPFFRQSLIARWNNWLQQKYGDESKLRAAWGGLKEGEKLESGAILFAPMAGKVKAAVSLNDANPLVQSVLEGSDQIYERKDFSVKRGEDVLQFLIELQMSHKKREAAQLKSWGRSCALSPLVYDTGIGYEIQSQYLHQNADAVAHDAYVNGWGPNDRKLEFAPGMSEHDKKLKRLDVERISANASGPDGKPLWVNWLLKPPGISQGVPWLEHNRVEGKPFLAYETQIQQPAKYRADYPLRLVALASIQDWDWVSWHYFASGDDVGENPRAFEKPMDVTSGSHPQGYHFTYDEVQNATMRAAALMFRNGSLRPAPNPTKFIYGRRSLLDPDSMTYAGSYGAKGLDMLQTVYQHGVRIQIDPTREDDQVIGPVVPFEKRLTHNPYAPTRQITFDWKRGFLMMDAPAAKAWTGLLARYGDEVKFDGGVKLRDVQIVNPIGIFDPVAPEEKYVAFALHSYDGKPLAQTRAAALSLVSTSYNSGFSMDLDGPRKDNGIPEKVSAGTLPVLTARVGATVEAPALDGMKYTFWDWNRQPIGSGTVRDGKLQIPADLPVFVVELTR